MAALTQAQINASLDWTYANLTGDVPDEFGGFPGQCLSLNRREFAHRSGLASAPNSPTGVGTGWMQRPGALADFFNPVEAYNPGIDYPRGSYCFNVPTNHIMIYDHREGSSAVVFEQNADPDHSPAGLKTRDGSRISHIMTPIIAPDVPFILSAIPSKEIILNKDTHAWDVNRGDFTDRAAHPKAAFPAGTVRTVAFIAHEAADNNSYYLESNSTTAGFHVGDCDDYTPPAAQPTDWKSIYKFERLPNPLNVATNKATRLWDLRFDGGYGNAEFISPLTEDFPFTAVGKATKLDFDEHPVYYLSGESFGNADQTGEPAFWQGVNTVDLKPAAVDTSPTPVIEAAVETVTPVDTPAVDDSEKIEVKVNPPTDPNGWKKVDTTQRGDYIVQVDGIVVYDLDGKAPDLPLPKDAHVEVAGTFIGPDHVQYWITDNSVATIAANLTPKQPNWRGIPVKDKDGNDVLKEDQSLSGFLDSNIDDFASDIRKDAGLIRKNIIRTAGVVAGDAESWVKRLKKRT